MTTPRRCDFCDFWHFPHGWEITNKPGQCRRHSPTVRVDALHPSAIWPLVPADGWCGEFAMRVFVPMAVKDDETVKR